MGIFRRDRAAGEASEAGDPEDFWDWWRGPGRALTTRVLASGEAPGAVDELSRAVHAVHPELAWELTPGEVSEHVFVVSPGGNPELRALARRWLLAAPASDETWAFSDHRPPRADPESVTLDSEWGGAVDFARLEVAARLSGSRFDVTVHHPGFAGLDAQARLQVAFVALDLALGEHDVELWIGEVQATEHSLVDGFGLSALRSVVRDHQARYVDPDGAPSWALMQGETADGTVLAAAQVPLHPVLAPQLGLHVAVLLPYRSVTAEGLPDDSSLTALRGFEDRLTGILGDNARLVAHQSSAGTRVLHVYADESSDVVARIRTAARAWPEGDAVVQAMADPAWESVAHLRG